MGAKNLGKLLRILQNVIKKSFINWRVLPLVKINTRISGTPCMYFDSIHYISRLFYYVNILFQFLSDVVNYFYLFSPQTTSSGLK
jgi:hypothetical protein